MKCFTCDGVGWVAVISKKLGGKLPCYRCKGKCEIPEEQVGWFEQGQNLKLKRQVKQIPISNFAKENNLDALVVSNLEIGVINPAPYEKYYENY